MDGQPITVNPFQSITFNLTLALQPKMNTTVHLSFSDDLASIYPSQVTFTPSTYNKPKPLLITANSPNVDTNITLLATAEHVAPKKQDIKVLGNGGSSCKTILEDGLSFRGWSIYDRP